jgi:hypothetical protein
VRVGLQSLLGLGLPTSMGMVWTELWKTQQYLPSLNEEDTSLQYIKLNNSDYDEVKELANTG